MKKYYNYKDSGIEWIGEIPEHWEIQRLKYAFNLGTGLSITKENLTEKGVPCVNYGEIHSKYGFEVDINKHNLKCVDLNYLNTSKKALLKQGEFIFADTSEDIEGSGNFTHIKSNGDIFAGYHTITARPIKKSNSLFFAFLFDSIDYRTQIRNSVKGIKVFSITQGILKDTFIWYPPISEQTTIANYLDHKTTQIDTLISKKQQFISLLQEERTAVINQAVTKGLDPKVQLKDSGIEWLGEIPEHWELRKISHAFSRIGSGTTPQSGNPIYHENGTVNWLNTGDLNDGVLKSCKKKVTEKALEDYSSLKKFPAGSLVMAMYGATIGKTCIIDFETTTNQACCVFCESDILDVNFLQYWFIGKKEHVINLAIGGGQPNISQNILKDIRVCCPDILEQKQIVKYIQNKTSEIDKLISKAGEEIELIKEYKTALISEVVTGKVDVRDAVLN